MREITLKVYKFEELDEDVQEKVLDDHRYFEVEIGDWWDCVYDMAKEEGVKIKAFDTYRMDIEVEVDIDEEAARKEILESGELGVELLASLDDDEEDEDALEEALEEALELYSKEKNEEAGEKWLKILAEEEEHLTSDEYIKDFLVANEYEFYENGKQV